MRHRRHARALAARLVSSPLVSVIVPSYNEELTIVGSVRALLALDYATREIIVVNDGSSDGTLAVLDDTFQLVPAPAAFAQPLTTAAVRGMYRSSIEPALVVVDKVNGDQSGRGERRVQCSVRDARAEHRRRYLARTGRVESGGDPIPRRLVDRRRRRQHRDQQRLPYRERAHHGGRAAAKLVGAISDRRVHARLPAVPAGVRRSNGVVLISGAFGLFRRDAVIAVGGFDRAAIGEDMDLTIRLQRYFRARGKPIRIAFDPNPLGWTQAPEDWRSLRSQRYRWRRGLLQVLWRHRQMIGQPRFGIVGLGVIPYILVFEGLGPLLEIAGYGVTAGAALLGLLNWQMFVVMLAVSVLFGAAVTLLALVMSDIATQRYMGGRDLVLLVAVVLLESCGYRQMNAWWGCVGTVQAADQSGRVGRDQASRIRGALGCPGRCAVKPRPSQSGTGVFCLHSQP